jgi:Holliday junction resolvase RusA-like endonuclease
VPKEKKTIKVRLPLFITPESEWRKDVHRAVSEVLSKKQVHYTKEDYLEIWITLYFEESKIRFVDVDNRTKHILDALQGLTRGYGIKKRALKPIIPNDNQVYRIIVEKNVAPTQSHGKGHLIMRKYKGDKLSTQVGKVQSFKKKKQDKQTKY